MVGVTGGGPKVITISFCDLSEHPSNVKHSTQSTNHLNNPTNASNATNAKDAMNATDAKYFLITSIWYLLLLVLWGVLPQPLNDAMIPITLTMILRGFFIHFDLNKFGRKA